MHTASVTAGFGVRRQRMTPAPSGAGRRRALIPTASRASGPAWRRSSTTPSTRPVDSRSDRLTTRDIVKGVFWAAVGAVVVFVAIVSLITLLNVQTVVGVVQGSQTNHSATLGKIQSAIDATHHLAKLQAQGDTTVGTILKEAGAVVQVLEADMAAVCAATGANCQPNG